MTTPTDPVDANESDVAGSSQNAEPGSAYNVQPTPVSATGDGVEDDKNDEDGEQA